MVEPEISSLTDAADSPVDAVTATLEAPKAKKPRAPRKAAAKKTKAAPADAPPEIPATEGLASAETEPPSVTEGVASAEPGPPLELQVLDGESPAPAAAADDPPASIPQDQPVLDEPRDPPQAQEGEPEPAEPAIPVPEKADWNAFQQQTLTELYTLGESLGLRVGGSRSKHQLVFDILTFYGRRGTLIEAEGILEIVKEGFGILRDPRFNFMPFPDDIFITPSVVRKLNLRNGQKMSVIARAPRDHKERFLVVETIVSIEGVPFEKYEPPTPFEKLTALFPTERIILENRRTKSTSARVVDIVAPLGKGQRGLICAPPRGGKTILLKEIAQSIQENHPEIELIVLMLDERPEEVTDFRETVQVAPNCTIIASTFDEPATRHQQVAELVMERAKRLVELRRDVVVLLDSLTRLTRGYNNCLKGGMITQGGISHLALQRAGKFFGNARKCEEGGSLTILATALIETDNKMDEVIFQEFKGKGNLEIQLDRELVERRIFPAINIALSGTRKDDLLYHPDEYRHICHIRKQMTQMPAGEAMEVLTKNIRATQNNAELLIKGLR